MTRRSEAQAASTRRSASMVSGVTWVQESEERWSQRMVHSTSFDLFFTGIVIMNSIFVGVEMQLSVSFPNDKFVAVQVGQYMFAFLFGMELFFRVLADRMTFFCGEDWAWAWLDIFIVFSTLWEVGLDFLYYLSGQDGQASALESVSGLKAFRIIRLTRLVKAVRLVRILRFVMAFRMLIASILNTLKSLFWALMLLALIVYVFAVLFTQAVNDHMLDPEAPELSPKDEEAGREMCPRIAPILS